MKWETLDSHGKLQDVLSRFTWHDSFVREVHLVSPSYVTENGRGTVSAECLPCVRVLVTGIDRDCPGIELLFQHVSEFGAALDCDLEPSAELKERQVHWRFNAALPHTIVSERLVCQFLDESSWGPSMRYGWEELFDGEGNARLPERS